MNNSSNENLPKPTFERLHELQVLLKKESALKELCKQNLYIILYF